MSSGANELDVSALRVRGIGDSRAVPVAWPFGEDEHVVAVEMHWVRSRSGVIHDDADGGVGAEVLGVPLRWVCEIAFVCKEEDWIVVVCAERSAVELPEEMAC